jgi:sugar phosphate permease
MRFLPGFVLWNIVAGSFPAFGAIYLQRALGMPLGKLGVVFSASQIAQFGAVLLAPAVFRKAGLAKGIAIIQICTAFFLILLAGARILPIAIFLYLFYFAAQFMCGPGIYNLLMNRIPERERSTASALQNLSGALCQSGAAIITGICIVSMGYRVVLLGNSVVAACAALLFVQLGQEKSDVTGQAAELKGWASPTGKSNLSDLEVTR